MNPDGTFIITSGNGFVINFCERARSPYMTSERTAATRFSNINDALYVANKMLEAGVVAHIVPMVKSSDARKHGPYKRDSEGE